MATELRGLEADQWDQWYGKVVRAFGGVSEPEEAEHWKRVTEIERALAVWDGDEVVGTAGTHSFRMTVPGGASVPTAGLTLVSVQTTHRRRGVLTSMMRRQLDDVRERGEPLAALTASEPAIYGRFGYGGATTRLQLSVENRRVGLNVPAGTDAVRMRVVTPLDGLGDCERVYAQLVEGRPGMLRRAPGWELWGVTDAPGERAGAGELLCVLAESQGEVRGFARYALKPDWTPGGPEHTVVVRDVGALDPVSYAALWRYLFAVDLSSTVSAGNRPADDPLLYLVTDLRRCHTRTEDGVFVRTVDVGTALAARTYITAVDVVLDVSDPFCPWNEGRWRLSGDAKGAVCARTTAPADLALSVRELGAAYLGGSSLAAMALAGRVREARPGALAETSAAFRSDLAPWLPHGF